MIWEKNNIKKENGTNAEAQAPIIISASRATDIPAFYSDWFIQRLKVGNVKWKNPFNGIPLYVSFSKTRLIVFWSKNPEPMIKHLEFLNDKNINYYFQYTLNDYENDLLELNVPKVVARIETFKKLSERIGKDKVIWRFDPLILTDTIGVDELLKKVEKIGNQLINHTNKLVFSFADIESYKKVKSNLIRKSINYLEFDVERMIEFAKGLQQLNISWNFEIGTCAEQIKLEDYGIIHNKCIDDDLIIKLFSNDAALMDFLGVEIIPPDFFNPQGGFKKKKSSKDKGQRKFCECIMSKDIGEYNTCPHKCVYCYANTSNEIVQTNYETHRQNPNSESISGI